MKFNLSKPEKDFLQKALNIVYSVNTCDHDYLLTHFKNDEASLDKVYPVLEQTVIYSKKNNRLYPKHEAFYNLVRAGIVYVEPYYYEGIFLHQQKIMRLFPEQIRPPEKALKPFNEAEEAGKKEEDHKRINKWIKKLLIADAIVGIVALIVFWKEIF